MELWTTYANSCFLQLNEIMGTDRQSLMTLYSETDALGIILFANETFCQVSQYSKEELIGKPHNLIRHPDMPDRLFENLRGTVKRGEAFRGVIKNKAKDGSHYWVQCTIMPLKGDENGAMRFAGVRHLIVDEDEAHQRFEAQRCTTT